MTYPESLPEFWTPLGPLQKQVTNAIKELKPTKDVTQTLGHTIGSDVKLEQKHLVSEFVNSIGPETFKN